MLHLLCFCRLQGTLQQVYRLLPQQVYRLVARNTFVCYMLVLLCCWPRLKADSCHIRQQPLLHVGRVFCYAMLDFIER